MITRIARKEGAEMLRDGRFRWAAAIVFALLLASLVMGGKHYRDVKRQHDLARAETRDQWLGQPAKNPHSAAHYGIYAFKPKMLPAFWIVNGLIAPRAIADLAKRVHPTPSAFAFQQAIDTDLRNGVDGHDPEDKRAEALKQRVMKQYGVDRLEALPVSFAGISLQEGEEHGNVVFDKHYSALWNRFEQQNRLKQFAGLLAPMLAINSVSMGLAGTDFAHHRGFAAALIATRRMRVD